MTEPKFSRVWAMPNGDTFSVKPIGEFVQRYLKRSTMSVDPFARNKRWATHTNDLNPETSAEYHLDARVFLTLLVAQDVKADLLILDPPYSPRQISECYRSAGLTATMKDTQNAKLYSECKALMSKLAKPGAVGLTFGWNSAGMGVPWTIEEIMLVAHGGGHNDTICTACRFPS